MAADQHDVEGRLDRLESRVGEVVERVSALEQEGVRQPYVKQAVPQDLEPPAAEEPGDLSRLMSLLGKSILILGGAFVLRALTESAVLPRLAGVAAGVAYAVVWMWIADRAARAGKRADAMFDAATAAVIGYPLIWETTTRFRLIPVEVAAVLVLALTLLLFWIAVRETHASIGWIATVAGGVAFIAVAIGAGSTLPLTITATLFAAIALHLTLSRGWSYMAWPAMIASDVLALALLGVALFRRSSHPPLAVMYGLLAFAGIWLVAVIGRAVILRRDLSLIEIAQVAEVTLIGTGGAAFTAYSFQIGNAAVASFAIAAGVALSLLVPKAGTWSLPALRATCSGLGALAVLLGSILLAGAPAASVAWAIIGVIAAEFARRRSSVLMLVQSVLWLTAAAIAGGVAVGALGALIDRSPSPADLHPTAVIVSALALVAYVRISANPRGRAARIVILSIAAAGALAGGVALFVSMTAAADPVMLALGRTGVLALIACATGVAGWLTGVREAGSVARAVIIVGGVKLLIEDIRVCSAAMMVWAFAMYGCAMLVVARTAAARRRRASGVTERRVEKKSAPAIGKPVMP